MRSAYTRLVRVLIVDDYDQFTARTEHGEAMRVRRRAYPIEAVRASPGGPCSRPTGKPILENFLRDDKISKMVDAVAVAVDAVPHFVLDEDYRIVEVGPAAPAVLRSLLGRDLWECYPDSEPLFRPYYEEARRTGEPVEFAQFYDGHVGRLRATPEGPRLVVSWEHVAHLEMLTLDGLRSSLAEVIAALEERKPEDAKEQRRDRLRLVVGDAR